MIQEVQKQIHAFVDYTPHNSLLKQDFIGLERHQDGNLFIFWGSEPQPHV